MNITYIFRYENIENIDGLAQDRSIASALTMETLQYRVKPSI